MAVVVTCLGFVSLILKISQRFQSVDQIVQTHQIPVFVISSLTILSWCPFWTVVDVNVGRQWNGFGKVDHPNANTLGVVNDQQTRSDHFVLVEKVGAQQILTQLTQHLNQLVSKLVWDGKEFAHDVLNLVRLSYVLKVVADRIAIALDERERGGDGEGGEERKAMEKLIKRWQDETV